MRVLQIAGTYPPGRCGVGDYVACLAGGLARAQVQVGVLTQRTATTTQAGVELMAKAGTWRLWESPRLLRAIRAWRPDLVHLHWPSQGFGLRLLPAALPRLCKRIGTRVVQTWHEPWPASDRVRFWMQRGAIDGLVFVRPNLLALMPPSLARQMPRCPTRVIESAGAVPASTLSEAERRELRARHLQGRKHLVVFFGFIHPEKGVEELFDVADPQRDALVIAGGVLDAGYQRRLEQLAQAKGWGGKVQFPGYLQPREAADLLAAADAVVLPFRSGGGAWNTSIHAALTQGTLVITTAREPGGDDAQRNLYTAPIAGVDAMRQALTSLAGRRIPSPTQDRWADIARQHMDFYREVLQPEPTR